MGRPVMFVVGNKIKSLDELNKTLKAEKWVFYFGVPKHPKFVDQFKFIQLAEAVHAGELVHAVPNPERIKRDKRLAKKSAPRKRRKKAVKS